MTYCDFHISEGWNVSGNDEGLELLNYVKLDPFLGCRRTDPPLSVITQDSDSVEDIGKLEREIRAKMQLTPQSLPIWGISGLFY